MRIIAGLTAGLTTLAAITALPNAPAAAPPPRVLGSECTSLAATVGPGNLWRATYWARAEDSFGHMNTFMLAPCFTSKQACEAWFYWAQTDWPDQIAIERCRTI